MQGAMRLGRSITCIRMCDVCMVVAGCWGGGRCRKHPGAQTHFIKRG